MPPDLVETVAVALPPAAAPPRSPTTTPPLPPDSGKRRPPAPPIALESLLGPDRHSGAGGAAPRGRPGPVAGGGHNAARRATAPSSAIPHVRDLSETSYASSGGHCGRLGGGAAVLALAREAAPPLEDENRALREELLRYQSEAIGSLPRRGMAAIAGGGFRGPAGAQQQRDKCACGVLKAKLARIRLELKEARCDSRAQQQESAVDPVLLSPELADAEAQTTPRAEAEARPAAAASADAAAQTDDAAVPHAQEAAAQTSPPARSADAGSQAGHGPRGPLVDAQTSAAPEAAEAASQAGPPPLAEAATQASEECASPPVSPIAAPAPQPPTAVEASMQTEMGVAADAEVQAGSPAALAGAAASQTDVPQTGDAEVQTAAPPPPETRTRGVQAGAEGQASRSVQTLWAPTASIGVQVDPGSRRLVHRGVQAEDEAALILEAQRESRLIDLEARLLELAGENAKLSMDVRAERERAEAVQQAMQNRAFSQMNITILCPRAECTVHGENMQFDSWNPQKLRQEFEREVLPRFARVFVDEQKANSGGKKPRSEAIDRAMEDFAEAFRDRLSAMLSAPNAAAAAGCVKQGGLQQRKGSLGSRPRKTSSL